MSRRTLFEADYAAERKDNAPRREGTLNVCMCYRIGSPKAHFIGFRLQKTARKTETAITRAKMMQRPDILRSSSLILELSRVASDVTKTVCGTSWRTNETVKPYHQSLNRIARQSTATYTRLGLSQILSNKNLECCQFQKLTSVLFANSGWTASKCRTRLSFFLNFCFKGEACKVHFDIHEFCTVFLTLSVCSVANQYTRNGVFPLTASSHMIQNKRIPKEQQHWRGRKHGLSARTLNVAGAVNKCQQMVPLLLISLWYNKHDRNTQSPNNALDSP